MTTSQAFNVTIENFIAEVTLLGPGKGNAMGPDFWAELAPLMAELDANNEVRAVIICGSGEHFSFGLDLKTMAGELAPALAPEARARARTDLYELILRMQAAITAVAEAKTPVIAAIHGWCIGGGLDLASAADIRYASADAKISLREAKVGMVADMGSLQRLPYIIGQGHTRELALTAKDISAARSLQIGLVTEVFDTKEELLAGARQAATEIAANPPLVIQGVKSVLNYPITSATADALTHVAVWNAAFLPSEDFIEAASAVMLKRPAVFSGN